MNVEKKKCYEIAGAIEYFMRNQGTASLSTQSHLPKNFKLSSWTAIGPFSPIVHLFLIYNLPVSVSETKGNRTSHHHKIP
jgi:hypothetical protein